VFTSVCASRTNETLFSFMPSTLAPTRTRTSFIPSVSQVPYSLGVEVSDRGALGEVGVSVAPSGLIPTSPTAFTVRLPCSGGRSAAEVVVTLTLNVTAQPDLRPGELTSLTLRRKKVCLEGQTENKLPSSSSTVEGKVKKKDAKNKEPGVPVGAKVPLNSSRSHLAAPRQEEEEETPLVPFILAESPPSTTLLLILGCSLGFLLILLAILTAAYLRGRKATSSVHSTLGFLQHMSVSIFLLIIIF
jgi:hypothetical protein